MQAEFGIQDGRGQHVDTVLSQANANNKLLIARGCHLRVNPLQDSGLERQLRYTYTTMQHACT